MRKFLKSLKKTRTLHGNFFISEHEVDRKIIGMQNITCNKGSSVKTIFNIVKQASICRGKLAKKDQRSSKYRIIQE